MKTNKKLNAIAICKNVVKSFIFYFFLRKLTTLNIQFSHGNNFEYKFDSWLFNLGNIWYIKFNFQIKDSFENKMYNKEITPLNFKRVICNLSFFFFLGFLLFKLLYYYILNNKEVIEMDLLM